MTDNLVSKARELLAEEFDTAGFTQAAYALRHPAHMGPDGYRDAALRAVVEALSVSPSSSGDGLEDADSGFDGDSVARAEMAWANLPAVRKWTSLATHEKALVVHTFARLSTLPTRDEVIEECARVVDDFGVTWGTAYRSMTDEIAKAIRSLKEQDGRSPSGRSAGEGE